MGNLWWNWKGYLEKVDFEHGVKNRRNGPTERWVRTSLKLQSRVINELNDSRYHQRNAVADPQSYNGGGRSKAPKEWGLGRGLCPSPEIFFYLKQVNFGAF